MLYSSRWCPQKFLWTSRFSPTDKPDMSSRWLHPDGCVITNSPSVGHRFAPFGKLAGLKAFQLLVGVSCWFNTDEIIEAISEFPNEHVSLPVAIPKIAKIFVDQLHNANIKPSSIHLLLECFTLTRLSSECHRFAPVCGGGFSQHSQYRRFRRKRQPQSDVIFVNN